MRFVHKLLLCWSLLLGASTAAVLAIDCAQVTCTRESGFYTYKYGTSIVSTSDDPYENQVGDIYLPDDSTSSPAAVVVLVHGGYWYDAYRRKTDNGSSMVPLALDLLSRGYAVVNLEYRRVGLYDNDQGINTTKGGMHGTFNDLTNGVDALQCIETKCGLTAGRLDLNRIAMVGHSAGGHLALWRTLEFGISAANRATYSLDRPVLNPIAGIGLAAVTDFDCGCTTSCDADTHCDAIENLLANGDISIKGHPFSTAELESTSPLHMMDKADAAASSVVKFLMVHGDDDNVVGKVQAERFRDKANTLVHMAVTTRISPPGTNENHFDVVNPTKHSWINYVVPFLSTVLAPPPAQLGEEL